MFQGSHADALGTCVANVRLPLDLAGAVRGPQTRACPARSNWLVSTGLVTPVRELSGGMQIFLIARSLVT